MKLVYATRKSALALAQSRAFVGRVRENAPGVEIVEEQIVTSGDKNQEQKLQDIGGKGLFIKELEEALYDRRADFAVHSIKDVPAALAPGLAIVCVPEREDPRDALISKSGASLTELPPGAVVGTSSLRRALCLLAARPDLKIEALRGNVDTRLRKVKDGAYDAIVLALAGLRRLGLAGEATQILDVGLSLPAIGQGALGIESRDGEGEVATILRRLHHAETATCVAAERALMKAVDGNCRMPVAAHAIHDGNDLWLRGFLAEADGSAVRRGERRQAWPESESEAELIGADLGAELKKKPA